jgi:glutamate-ammonia-ligase adenylyltransferase
MSVPEHLTRLERLQVSPSSLDPVRIYRQAQLLRILLRDVLGLADLETLLREQSTLAEACLLFINRLQGNETTLTIIALGKFGGGEIGYGADLDVLFVGDDVRAAQNLAVTMAQPTAEGFIRTLDARLRPDGEKGPLACSIAAYEAYYETRAQLWEVQALTRARPIAGPEQEQFMALARRVWEFAARRDDLFAQIRGMLQRIRQDRGSAADFYDFKTGTGGIIEAEFLIQALQWRGGIWEPQTTGALSELSNQGLLQKDEAAQLRSHYHYLRTVESVLRRWENKSVSTLPSDEIEQGKLVRRMGAKSLDSFGQCYREARDGIHAISLRYLQ